MARVLHALCAAALAAPLALAVTVATVGPSAATVTSGGGGGHDPSARPGQVRAQITFTKRPAHPWKSRISWVARRQQDDGTWKTLARDSWRAGSGLPGRHTTDACVKGQGWLPDGRYPLRQYDDYDGTLIHGRVFRLADKRCADGTLREQLFIHTEAGPGNTQCPDKPGDQLCRWEFPKINDYTSHGCIKMSPAAILALTRDFHRFFEAGVRYRPSRVSLLVR
jgi:hypothetical protein